MQRACEACGSVFGVRPSRVLAGRGRYCSLMCRKRDVADRFWEKKTINLETGCWEWASGRCGGGYGLFTLRTGVTRRAHRVAYELAFGPIPGGDGYHGTCVCHRCDNPCCINPAHLFLGTHQENILDASVKGRLGKKTGENAA